MSGNPAKTGEIFSKDASYFERNNNADTQKVISQWYYTDSKSSLHINILADRNEIAENLRTGRILSKLKEVKSIKVRPHIISTNGVKNPEYEINGLIADAKRINHFSGVTAGFAKAKKQGSEAIIIDLHNIKSKGHKLNIPELASGIVNRAEDFRSGNIKECYVVWGDKCTKIEANMFNGYDKKDRYDYITRVKKIIYQSL
jgi:hypothetical protein